MSLQNYQLINKIGKGKYCTVYQVINKSDGSSLALKKINLNTLDKRGQYNVQSQVNLLKFINHQHIVQLKTSFHDERTNHLCLVLQLAKCDLGEYIFEHSFNKQQIPQDTIWSMIQQITSALEYLHRNNILHRDIKPTNILLFQNDQVKISDFNVSKITDNLTHTRTGTLQYASPEIWNSQPYNSKSDIWSFGCLVYELVCLRKAFNNEDIEDLYKKINKCQYQKISKSYSKELRDLVNFMLQNDPKLRPSAHTIWKMCQGRKNIGTVNKVSRIRGTILTPTLKPFTKDDKDDADRSKIYSNRQQTVSLSKKRLYSQISKKYYQPTFRKPYQLEDKLSNISINKDITTKNTNKTIRYLEPLQQFTPSGKKPRIIHHHKFDRETLKRSRRNTQI